MKLLSRFRFSLMSLLRFALFAGAVLAVVMRGPWERVHSCQATSATIINTNLSRNGTLFSAVGFLGDLCVIDLRTCEVWKKEFVGGVNQFVISPNGLFAAELLHEKNGSLTLTVWDLMQKRSIGQPFTVDQNTKIGPWWCDDTGCVAYGVDTGGFLYDYLLFDPRDGSTQATSGRPLKGGWANGTKPSSDDCYVTRDPRFSETETLLHYYSNQSVITTNKSGGVSVWSMRYEQTAEGHLSRPEVWLAIVTGLWWLWGLLPKRRVQAALAPEAA